MGTLQLLAEFCRNRSAGFGGNCRRASARAGCRFQKSPARTGVTFSTTDDVRSESSAIGRVFSRTISSPQCAVSSSADSGPDLLNSEENNWNHIADYVRGTLIEHQTSA